MRVLGIDYGDRHIGLAVSDPLQITAQPLETYDLKADEGANRRYFRELIARLSITEIIIGFPLRMDGSEGTRAAKTREFAAWLEETVHRPIVFWDERLTTREALQVLREQNVRGKKAKSVEDAMSATIILSSYLEKKRGELGGPQG